MSLDAHFIHACTVERVSKTLDAYGNESRETWATHLSALPCRLVERSQTVRVDETAQFLPITRYVLLVSANADVRVSDRIKDVSLGHGHTETGPFVVTQRLQRRSNRNHHISLTLERVA